MDGLVFFRRSLRSLVFGSIAGVAAVIVNIGTTGPARAEAPCIKLSDVETVQLQNRWKAEFTSGNVERVAALYADAATLIASKDGEPHKGKEAIRAYYKDLLAKRPMISIRPSSLTSDCGTAVVSGPVTYRLTGERKGTRAVLGGTYTMEYALKDGTWSIVRHFLAADRRGLGKPAGAPASKPSPPL